MKMFLVVLVAGLASCNNGSEVKTTMDSTVNQIENSETLDSIKSKGKNILDSVKRKGSEAWDSTKSKSGKLIDKAGEMLKKDSVR